MYYNTVSDSFIYDKFTNIRKRFTKSENSYPQKLMPKQKSETKKDSDWSKANIGILVFGLGLLFLSRGVQKNSKKLLEIVREYFENKINKSALDEHTTKISLYEHFVHRINSFIKKTESINNINSLKDILFMKLMYKTLPTRKIHQAISNSFEYLSRNTVIKSYQKTQKLFNKMYEKFDKLDEYIEKNIDDEIVEYNGQKYSKKALHQQAKDCRDTVRIVMDSFMDEKTLQTRYKYIKDTTSELSSKFWNASFSGFWSKNNKFKRKEMWQTFIASEQIKANKTDLAIKAAYTRSMLSYTDSEMKSYVAEYLDNIFCHINKNDNESLSIIKKLKWYIKDSYPLRFNKENFLDEIKKLEERNNNWVIENESEEIIKNDIDQNINLIRYIIREDAPGELQKMLDIYRKIAPIELSRFGTLDLSKECVSQFDKSVKLETRDLFDKLRDLEIGSAPTDILTILFSSGAIVYALIKAKNSSEKKSIILTSGIPIVGGVLTTLISATKLISGSKSVVLGLISGLILNQAGLLADKYNKHRKVSVNN